MSLKLLSQLQTKKQNLENKIKQQQAKISAQYKKDDTRRKILIGAYFLEKNKKENTMEQLKKILDNFLFRPNDRALFELEPKENTKKISS